jgi:probable O-glycosylation ligase (exosortase A-associated)
MRDLVFIGYLLVLLGMGMRRPFLFTLGYVYIDLVSPQRLAYYMLASIPISLIFFLCAVLGWLAADDKQGLRIAPRQVLMLLMLVWCGYTTFHADFSLDAFEKWDWVWKTLTFAIFLPLTLSTRLRIQGLLAFMILSAASIIITGGIKTLASGGGYGELNLGVSNNSGLYEGSTISTVAVAIIPLILFMLRHDTIFPRGKLKALFCYALIFACLLIPVGTVARTGLLCLAVLGMLMLRNTRRRILYLCIAAAGVATAIPLLPDSYTQRMNTIGTYQADESASTRVAVWNWTLEYVSTHPNGGGFGAYRQNRFSYNTVTVPTDGSAPIVEKMVDSGRAWHSSYFEMLGEQGWVGLAMWLLLNLTGLVRMEVLRHRYRKDPALAWIAELAAALQAAQVVYLVGSLFIAIAFQSFIYMLIGLQIGLDGYAARQRKREPWGRPKPSRIIGADASKSLDEGSAATMGDREWRSSTRT